VVFTRNTGRAETAETVVCHEYWKRWCVLGGAGSALCNNRCIRLGRILHKARPLESTGKRRDFHSKFGAKGGRCYCCRGDFASRTSPPSRSISGHCGHTRTVSIPVGANTRTYCLLTNAPQFSHSAIRSELPNCVMCFSGGDFFSELNGYHYQSSSHSI
jgi:hypothetical protein